MARKDSTGHLGQDNQDRITVVGQAEQTEQDSQDRTTGQDNQDKTFVAGHWERTVGKGQSRQVDLAGKP
jgi:hypothetical protein